MAKPHRPTAVRPKKPANFAPLELKERIQLIAILNDPIMQKALANAATLKPSVFVSGVVGTQLAAGVTPEHSLHVSNNRLHEIRGWEQFEAAIFAQTLDPKPKRTETPENFPPTGMIDHENE